MLQILSEDSNEDFENWVLSVFGKNVRPANLRNIISVPCQPGYIKIGSMCIKTLN